MIRKMSETLLQHPPRLFTVLIHGGAGVISREHTDENVYRESLQKVLSSINNYVRLQSDISALDVVEYGVRLLEEDPLFNAGRGSVYTSEGTHELEASIMEGEGLQCGAVSLSTSVRHPVSLARQILHRSPHNYLVGESALQIAREAGLEFVENSFFDTDRRKEQLHIAKQAATFFLDHNIETDERETTNNNTTNNDFNNKDLNDKTGTVGCVCMLDGHVAAATSTGGMTNKATGRIGDSPIIGAGTFADDRTCAVSCTGVGEIFQRFVAAYDISARIEYKGASLREAARGTVFERLPADSGGVIAVNVKGEYAMEFNTSGMFRGGIDSNGLAKIGIWEEEEHFSL